MRGRSRGKHCAMIVRGNTPTYASTSGISTTKKEKGALVLFDSSLSGTLTAFMLTGKTTTAKRGMAVFFAF